jgi:hypothetical protein
MTGRYIFHNDDTSIMFKLLSTEYDRQNQDIIANVKQSFCEHPVVEGPFRTPVCFDDEQWHVYKRMIARIAKERSKPKEKKTLRVRNHRDEKEPMTNFDGPIASICDKTFVVRKFKNFDHAMDGRSRFERMEITKCLKGFVDKIEGYYWITF